MKADMEVGTKMRSAMELATEVEEANEMKTVMEVPTERTCKEELWWKYQLNGPCKEAEMICAMEVATQVKFPVNENYPWYSSNQNEICHRNIKQDEIFI